MPIPDAEITTLEELTGHSACYRWIIGLIFMVVIVVVVAAHVIAKNNLFGFG